MKKFLGVLALASVFAIAACESREETNVIDEPLGTEEPATAPVFTEPTPPPPPMTTTPADSALMAPGAPGAPEAAPGSTTTPGTTTNP